MSKWKEKVELFVYLAADLTFCRSLSAWTLTDDPISIGYPLSLASWYRSTLSYCVLFRWHGTQSRRTSCDEWSFKEVGKNLEIQMYISFITTHKYMYHGINWSDIDLLYFKLLLLILSFIIYNLYISTGMSTSACKKKCLKAWNFIHFTTIN